ncbi:MAG: hypothetical protein AAGA56_20580 [Myxococcota bacterium]
MAYLHVPDGAGSGQTDPGDGGGAWMRELTRVLELRPTSAAPLLASVEATLREGGGMSREDRLTVAITIARIHDCEYLVSALTRVLEASGMDAAMVSALTRDDRLARVTPRVRAMIDFGILVSDDPHLISRVTINDLRARAGLVAEDVVDLVQLVGTVSHLARAALALGVTRARPASR